MNSEKPTQEEYNNWHKDPNNWYLGFLYYNRKDKDYSLQKEYGDLDQQ